MPSINPFARSAVLPSPDFARVDSLPRRTWTEAEGQALADQLTPRLKTLQGTMRLKAVQAIFLREAYLAGGVFAPMGVGCGKTLASLLLATLIKQWYPGARVVLIIAAGLDNDGRKQEVLQYAQHWRLDLPEVLHFQELQTVPGKDRLDQMAPTHIIIDECQLFKNPKAARTKRMKRYMKANPHTRVYAMTGTIMKRSIKDFAHVLLLCLKENAPVPLAPHVLDSWADALDERLDMGSRSEPGQLLEWAKPDEIQALGELDACRVGFQRRLLETTGVVGYSLTAKDLPSRVEISEVRLVNSTAVQDAFKALRKWELPDGTELVEALEIQRHARTLPLGYWLRWKYAAPPLWLEKRKAAAGFIRQTLQYSRKFDSPKEIYLAYPNQPELTQWLAIKDTYEPETVPEWYDGQALAVCRAWLAKGGVAFTENTVFGQALASVAGVPYFGAGGLDSCGRSIDQYTGPACCAGTNSNDTGRNLQRWSRMLLCAPRQNGPQIQQHLGRMQRLGQTADVVEVSILVGCIEHLAGWWQSWSDCRTARNLTANSQIVLDAHVQVTPLDQVPSGPEWDKNWGRVKA